MLIGINGFKGAGKDTVAAYLVKNHGFTRLAFADLLKLSVATLFNIPIDWIDTYKDEPNCYVAIGFKNDPAPSFNQIEGQPSKMWSPMTEMTLREFLKRYGTESHRDVFGDDFWIEQLFKERMGSEWHRGSRYCVSDARFENELRFIRDLDGFNVRVMRPGLTADEHRSEQIPSPDLIFTTIDNSGDFHHLEEEVSIALNKIIWDAKELGWRNEGDM